MTQYKYEGEFECGLVSDEFGKPIAIRLTSGKFKVNLSHLASLELADFINANFKKGD
jgi:hypothetical protein